MKASQVIDFLVGWLGSLALYLIFWGYFSFFIALLYIPHIIATIFLWKGKRYTTFGLLFAMPFVAIPIVFWDWWRESSVQYWFVEIGHSIRGSTRDLLGAGGEFLILLSIITLLGVFFLAKKIIKRGEQVLTPSLEENKTLYIIFRISASLVIAFVSGMFFTRFWCNLPGRCLDMFGGVGPFVGAAIVLEIIAYLSLLYLGKILQRINQKYNRSLFYVTIIITLAALLYWIFTGYSQNKEREKRIERQKVERREAIENIKRTTGVFYPTYFPPSLDINPIPQEIPFPSSEGRIDLRYYSSSSTTKTILSLEQSEASEWGRPLSTFFKRPPIHDSVVQAMRPVILRDGTEAVLIEHTNDFFMIYLDKAGLRINISLNQGSAEDLIKIAESLQ